MSLDASLDMPFDQYQRYRLVADILDSLRSEDERLSVLDVGGRTALLRQFLPEDEVHLVDVEASDVEDLVLGDGSRLPYGDNCVDALVTFDTLEHVPPALREAFVSECARVARRWVVIAGPYQSPRVEEAETKLEVFIHEKLGEEHRYLAEHKANGLPDRDVTEKALRAAGAEVVSIGHANIERWLALMCMSLYMDRDAPLRAIAKHYWQFYNAELYASDHAEPVYRHAVVAAFDGAALPDPATLLAPPQAPEGAVDVSMELVGELLKFDAQRDVIAPEWERLEEVNLGMKLDLEGHKRTLIALREVQDEQTKMISELQNQCIELRSNEEELEDENEREREESQAAIGALNEDLAAHALKLSEVEAELAEHKLLVAKLEADSEKQREAAEQERVALETDLAGHKQVLEESQVEAASLAEMLQEQTSLREASDKVREALQHELAAQKLMLDEFVGEVGELRTMHAREQEERESAEDAHGVMKVDLDGHRALVDDLRQELIQTGDMATDLEAARHAAAVRAEDLAARAASLSDQTEAQREVIDVQTTRAQSAEEGIAMLRSEFEAQNMRLHETHVQLAEERKALADEREVLMQYRLEMRMRWGNLKRAFGPKPTFGPD